MEKDELERFKRVLTTLAVELEKSLDAGKDLTAVVSLDDPIGRLSRIDALQSQEIALGLKESIRRRLDMVHRALNAISGGTYGSCVACKQPIAAARLEAIPETPLCVECSA